jgi:hypothetical protein
MSVSRSIHLHGCNTEGTRSYVANISRVHAEMLPSHATLECAMLLQVSVCTAFNKFRSLSLSHLADTHNSLCHHACHTQLQRLALLHAALHQNQRWHHIPRYSADLQSSSFHTVTAQQKPPEPNSTCTRPVLFGILRSFSRWTKPQTSKLCHEASTLWSCKRSSQEESYRLPVGMETPLVAKFTAQGLAMWSVRFCRGPLPVA